LEDDVSKYVVRVFETSVYEYELDADSEDMAVTIAQNDYENDDTTRLVQVWSERDDSVPYVKKIGE
jgi:hypothetical protein